MKKLLFHFDTDEFPSSFDAVVAYDGGADQLLQYARVTPDVVGPLVDGIIYTRPTKQKQYSAIFVSGSDMEAGEKLFAAIRKKFFSNFRVSVMLDSNGCNTTAAAGVARITSVGSIAGKRAVVLAGTGPVGQRAAVMLGKEGAQVVLTSRKQDRAEAVCSHIKAVFDVEAVPMQVTDDASTLKALEEAQIVFAAGKSGVQLLKREQWVNNPTIEIMADVNAEPPLGIEGIEMGDKGEKREGKIIFGGLGIGGLKLRIHRACIEKLFESNNQVFDAETVYELAKAMVAEE